MNNDIFLIEESDLEQAKDICKYIKDSEARSRAVASALAADISGKYFVEIEPDIKTGIHNIAKILESLEISDIYLNGNYIDVRLYFENGEMTIPKYNFDNDLQPLAYMFIKVEEELSGGLVTGFVLPSSIDTSNSKNGYYLVSENDLVSFYDIQPLLLTPDEIDLPEDFDKQAFELLDGKHSNPAEMYKLLILSEEARTKLATMSNVQTIFNYVSFDNIETPSATENIEQPEELEEPSQEILLEEDSSEPSLLEDFEEEQTFALTEAEEELTSFSDESENEDFLLETSDSDFNVELEEHTDVFVEEISDIENEPPIVETIESSFSIDTTPDIQTLELNETTSVAIEGNNETLTTEEVSTSDEEFTTVVTPSLDVIEDSMDTYVEETVQDVSHEDEDDDAELLKELENSEPVVKEEYPEQQESNPNSEQIEALFGSDDDDEYIKPKQKSSLVSLLGILLVLAGLGGAGYYAYNEYFNSSAQPIEPERANQAEINETVAQTQANKKAELPSEEPVAMPNETVENVKTTQNSNEGNSISIPAIEQNLDASILVSNLSVYWEVPQAYVSNTTVQRYFRKLGKIIQLNLKTELLLLSKPPISNKIVVELNYNKTAQKFEVKSVKTSSGEDSVDKLIVKTIENALNMNLRTNTSSFKALSGNPMLVIRL